MANTPDDDHESEYGDVDYADPKNHKYPINNEERVRAAWSYINMPKNQAGYTPGEVASIKAKIKAAGKKFGITFEDDGGGRSAPSDDVEFRFTAARVELRAGDDDGTVGREIFGYAAVFNSPSRDLGYFVERSAPGFLNKACADGWPGAGAGVVCRFNHDPAYLLGTTRGGTLRLSLDRKGLLYSALLPECRSDVREYAARHDLNGSSFAMIIPDGGCEWAYDDSGVVQRTLVEAQLIDVAPVSEPAAYPAATVGLRSLAHAKGIPEDDVFDLARRDELRKVLVRTDQGPPVPPLSEPPADMLTAFQGAIEKTWNTMFGASTSADTPSNEPSVDEVPPAEASQLELDTAAGRMSTAVAVARMHILGLRTKDPIRTS